MKNKVFIINITNNTKKSRAGGEKKPGAYYKY
jgi:hypothetical protein